MAQNVDIKVRTVVDSSDLEGLNKKLSNYSEKIGIGVDADTKTATDKLREVQKKAKEITAEKTLVNIGVATEGLQEIKKIKSEYKALKNMLPPKFRVEMDNAAEAKVEEIRKKINDLDGLSPQIKTIIESEAIDELQAIQRASDNLDGLSPKLKPVVDDSEALGALQNIQNQAEGLSGLESGMAGVLGTFGAEQLLGGGIETATNMDKAWRNWVGSLQQAGMGFDQAKAKADQFKSTVNKLASEGQSTDSLFKNVAGLAINLNNQISDSTLQMTEKVVAGYEMLGGRTGATLYEMEKEVKNFLATGDLGLMEDTLSSLRDPAKWKGLLEGAKTVDERIKVMNDMLQEEGIMGALNIDAPSKSIDSLKALFEAAMTNIGTSIINIVKPIADGLMWLDEVTNGASTSILSTVAVVGLLGVGLIGLGGALGSVLPGLGNLTGSMARFVGIAGSIPEGPGGPGGDKGGKGGGGFLSWLTNMNNFASTAAKGTGPAALSWTTLSAGISSMLAPMLMVSAVVAIMIPIVAGLVIEVLLFVRLIGEVVKALQFDKLDLGSSIEGIKQIGLAMWELGRAFASLTLVNMVGIIYSATGGILTTSLALAQFMIASKEIEVVLNQINSLKVDQSSVNKITQIKNVLTGIANSMNSMSSLNLAGLGTLLSGGVEAVKTNIKNISEIGLAIQDMTIPTVGADKVTLITNLANVITKLSEASQAVEEANGWFQTKVLNYDDVTGMQATLRNLGEIAKSINNTTIPSVGKEKVDLVNALSNVIKPLAEASKAVDNATGTFQTSVLNIDDVEGMQATLRNLALIAENIMGADIPPVDSAKIDAVRNIKNVIMPIVESAKAINDNWQAIVVTPAMALPFSAAISALYIINQKLNSTPFNLDSSKTEAISNLKTVIQRVAEIGLYLSQNSSNIGSNITSNATALSSSISSLYVVNQKINSSAFALAPEKVAAINNLKPFIQRVAEIGLYLSNNSGNLAAIAANQASLSGAIQSLYLINQQINSMPFQVDEAKTTAINSLNSLIQTIVNTLNAAAGVQGAAKTMGSEIVTGFNAGAKNLGTATVTILKSAIDAVKNRYPTMRSAGNALGAALVAGFKSGAGINSPMAIVISGMNATISHITSLASSFYDAGSALGSSLTAGWSDEQKDKANATDLLRANKGSVMSIFNSSGINWMGGSASAAGGDISPISAAGGDFEIEYPSQRPNLTINSTIMTQDQIDIVWELYQKGKAQDNLRTRL